MLIRSATAEDWPGIWPFFHEIVSAGDTYTYDPDLTEPQARALWMLAPPAGRTFVTVDEPTGEILGSAKIAPNFGGNGSHVANGSYMVSPTASGRGVGRALCLHSLDAARADGYRAMQFNAVVETNSSAIHLWQSLGFRILTTIPKAFNHPTHGYVGLHVMYQEL